MVVASSFSTIPRHTRNDRSAGTSKLYHPAASSPRGCLLWLEEVPSLAQPLGRTTRPRVFNAADPVQRHVVDRCPPTRLRLWLSRLWQCVLSSGQRLRIRPQAGMSGARRGQQGHSTMQEGQRLPRCSAAARNSEPSLSSQPRQLLRRSCAAWPAWIAGWTYPRCRLQHSEIRTGFANPGTQYWY